MPTCEIRGWAFFLILAAPNPNLSNNIRQNQGLLTTRSQSYDKIIYNRIKQARIPSCLKSIGFWSLTTIIPLSIS